MRPRDGGGVDRGGGGTQRSWPLWLSLLSPACKFGNPWSRRCRCNVSRVLSRSTFSLPGGFDRWGNLSKLCWEIHQEGDRPGDMGCRDPGLCCHPSADFGIYCGSQRSNKWHKYAKKPKASTLSTPPSPSMPGCRDTWRTPWSHLQACLLSSQGILDLCITAPAAIFFKLICLPDLSHPPKHSSFFLACNLFMGATSLPRQIRAGAV